MIKTLVAIVVAIALSAASATAVVSRASPSTADLDQDIATVTTQIAETKTEAARYSGGAIAIEVELRAVILKSTLAMLEQKRASYLRGISVIYRDPTPRAAPALNDNDGADLAKAKADVIEARMEAARYSGGLIQVMAMLREATAKVTLASVEQRIALARVGISMPSLAAHVEPAARPPGKTVADKDAL